MTVIPKIDHAIAHDSEFRLPIPTTEDIAIELSAAKPGDFTLTSKPIGPEQKARCLPCLAKFNFTGTRPIRYCIYCGRETESII